MATPNTPSNDDSNIRKGNPDPTPPPPSAINPVPNTSQTLDEFYKQFKELNKMLEKSTDALEKQSKLDQDATFAKMAADRAQKKLIETTAKLEKEMAQYRDENGKFRENAKKQEEKYNSTLARLKKASDKAEEGFKKASDAAAKNSKIITTEVEERKKSLDGLRELQGNLSNLDEELQGDLKKDLKTVTASVDKQVKAVQRSENKRQGMLDAAAQRKIDREAAQEKENLKVEQDANDKKAEQAEEEEKIDAKLNTAKRKLREFTEAQRSEDIKKRLVKSGGIVGLTDIQGKLSEIMEKKVLEFIVTKPKATDDEIAAFREETLKTVKNTEVISELQKELSVTIATAEKEELEKIMKEQRVSESTARVLLERDKTFKERLKQETKNHEETIKAVEGLQDSQLQELYFLQEKDAKESEKLVEAQNQVPRWAALFIDNQKKYGELLKWSNIKSDGFLKTLIFLIVVIVGATLGYIWNYIKLVYSAVNLIIKGISGFGGILQKIGLGKIVNIVKEIFASIVGVITRTMGSIGRGLGGLSSWFSSTKIGSIIVKAFSAIFSGTGTFLKSTFTGIKAIVGLFPSVMGFFTKFMSAFMFGFRVLGKVFFWFGLAIDVLMGAFKGFKEMGNIKGIILGIVAGIVNFFTFGLIDFKTIFDLLKNTLGYLIDAFMWAAEPLIQGGKQIFAYFKQFISKITEIFQGNGSFIGKLIKAIGAGVGFLIKTAIVLVKSMLLFAVRQIVMLPILLIQAVVGIIAWLWDWVTSGKMLGDFADFGVWLMETFVDLWTDIMDGLADALGDIPFIGKYIKSFLGGGTAATKSDQITKEVSKTIATSTTNAIVESSTEIRPAGVNEKGIPIYTTPQRAAELKRATSSIATTKDSMRTGSAVIVNSPTTNNVVSGGGENVTLVPLNSRNHSPPADVPVTYGRWRPSGGF